jgi:hypothetical protein
MQNARLFPRIHKTLEIYNNNSIKEGGVILFVIKQKGVMGAQNALNN